MILNFYVFLIKAYEFFPGRAVKNKNNKIGGLFIAH